MNEDNLPPEENFSDDPEENLRMQNDFLKMKMMAESGAYFGGEGGLPPEIENEFLKNIMEFEKVNANAKTLTVYELLGQPDFEDENNLKQEKFETEYLRLSKLLEDHGIDVSFMRERDDRFKYNFIIKELFQHQTTFVPVKGMITGFIYEEFHPDHELDITEMASRFLNDFFERNLDVNTYYLDEEIILPEGKTIPRESIINRFLSMYEAIPEFQNTSFVIENKDIELHEKDDEQTGMGFCEGTVQYDIILQDGEWRKIKGPFKIYFSLQYDCWTICFFYLAGFNINPTKI